MDISILKDSGLTEGEIKVYLALLELGVSSTGPIVEKSGIAKSIIYQILEKLIQKGLVSYIIKEKTKYFQASEPEKILEYIDEREKKLKENKEKVQALLPQLSLLKTSAKESEARIYEGFKGITTAYEHVYDKLKQGDSYFFIGVDAYQPEKYHMYWKRDHLRREKAGIHAQLFFNQGTEKSIVDNRNSYKNAEARYMPISVKTPAWFMGYKDVTLIGLQTGKEMALEIVNKEIAQSFKSYFDAFWNQKTRTYTGKDGVYTFFELLLDEKEVWFIGGNFGIKWLFPEYWATYRKKRLEHKVIWHDLLAKKLLADDSLEGEPYYECRILPKELQSPHVIGIYRNTIFNLLWSGKETTIFSFENKEIAQSYKNYFNLLWKQSKSPSLIGKK